MRGEHAAEPEGQLPVGHYRGLTTQGQPISFDIVDRGISLRCLTFKIDSGSLGEITLADEPITITGAFKIDSDGHFGDTVIGDGIRAIVVGTVTPAGTATGTLRVDFDVPQSGVGVNCSSGNVSWTASAS